MPDLLHIEPMTREEAEALADVGAAWLSDGTASPHVETGLDKLRRALNPQPEEPALRREKAVDQLLDLAKLADDDQMREQLEGLASRFSLPPAQPEQKHCGGSGEIIVDHGGKSDVATTVEKCPGCPDPGCPTDQDASCTHRATRQDDGWWRAEYRLESGGEWISLSQRFSDRIGRAETEFAAWAAREGALQVLASQQPQQEGEEDWPDQIIARVKVGDDFFFAVKHYPERDTEMETRRYIPAPEQGEQPPDFDPLQTEHLEATLQDALDFVQEHHERYSDETGDTLEGDLTDTLDAIKNDQPPNQGEGSGERSEELREAQVDIHEAERIAAEWAARNEDADQIASILSRVRSFLDELPYKPVSSPRAALERLAEEFERQAEHSEIEAYSSAMQVAANRLRQEISSLSPQPDYKAAFEELDQVAATAERALERLPAPAAVDRLHLAKERQRIAESLSAEPQEGDGR